MKKILIPVNSLKQPNSDACSITCARMILAYYGLNVTDEEIFKFIIKATSDGGSFLSEIGRFAKHKGFDVDLYAFNLYLTDSKDDRLLMNELLDKLEKQLEGSRWDKYYDLMVESTIKGIKEGVNYTIKKPDFRIIKTYLNNKTPVSVRLNYAALVGKQGDPFDTHDVVLSGLGLSC